MELATIKGDTALLIYHPAEGEAAVGSQLSLLETSGERSGLNGLNGLIVQVVANELAEHEGLMQGVFQRILEARLSNADIAMDHERGMGELGMLKVARTKIRKRVVDREWREWDGYVPSRNVQIAKVSAEDLLRRIIPPLPRVPLPAFVRHGEAAVAFDGPRLGHVTAITGRKGTGKSHLAKHLVLSLAGLGVPTIVYDYNGEYGTLPHAQVLRWRDNFRLSLSESGHAVLRTVVAALSPLQPGSPSEATFEARLPSLFADRRTACLARGTEFQIDLPYLLRQNWSDNSYISAAIHERLETVDEMGLFAVETSEAAAATRRDSVPPASSRERLADLYASACAGRPIVFERGEASPRLFGVLVRAVNQIIERHCRPRKREEEDGETSLSSVPLPYVVYDEAHLYLSEESMLSLLSRVRHVGVSAIFLSNTPRRLPSDVFRQADNLIVLPTRHEDDLKALTEIALADAESIKMLASRLPRHHALVLGTLTDGYPLVVAVEPLPEGVPASGVTRSAWDAFL